MKHTTPYHSLPSPSDEIFIDYDGGLSCRLCHPTSMNSVSRTPFCCQLLLLKASKNRGGSRWSLPFPRPLLLLSRCYILSDGGGRSFCLERSIDRSSTLSYRFHTKIIEKERERERTEKQNHKFSFDGMNVNVHSYIRGCTVQMSTIYDRLMFFVVSTPTSTPTPTHITNTRRLMYYWWAMRCFVSAGCAGRATWWR